MNSITNSIQRVLISVIVLPTLLSLLHSIFLAHFSSDLMESRSVSHHWWIPVDNSPSQYSKISVEDQIQIIYIKVVSETAIATKIHHIKCGEW